MSSAPLVRSTQRRRIHRRASAPCPVSATGYQRTLVISPLALILGGVFVILSFLFFVLSIWNVEESIRLVQRPVRYMVPNIPPSTQASIPSFPPIGYSMVNPSWQGLKTQNTTDPLAATFEIDPGFVLYTYTLSHSGETAVYTVVRTQPCEPQQQDCRKDEHRSYVWTVKNLTRFRLHLDENGIWGYLPVGWTKNDKKILAVAHYFSIIPPDASRIIDTLFLMEPKSETQKPDRIALLRQTVIFDDNQKAVFAEEAEQLPKIKFGLQDQSINASRIVYQDLESGVRQILFEKPYRNYLVTPEVIYQDLARIRINVERLPDECQTPPACETGKTIVKDVMVPLP